MTETSQTEVKDAGYLRIGDTARIVGVSQATLRLWERHGLVRSQRTAGGYRMYSSDDLEELMKVRALRLEGVNLAGISQMIVQPRKGSPQAEKRAAPPAAQSEVHRYVGRKLRQARQGGGVTLTQLSRKCGLSQSFLSLLERGMCGASLESIQRICKALGIDDQQIISRPKQQNLIHLTDGRRPEAPSLDAGIKIEQLTGSGSAIDCEIFHIAPGKRRKSKRSYTHAGEELIFVLEGEISITLGGKSRYRLKKGDSLYFSSGERHSWSHNGRTKAVVMWINVNGSHA